MDAHAIGTATQRPDKAQLLHELNTNGYAILRAYFPPAFIARLLNSARKLTHLARNGQWPHLRTCPKQFPPWETTAENGIWGVQHLLHPDLTSEGRLSAEEARVFAELYFSDAIADVTKDIFGLDRSGAGSNGDERLILELFNLLVTPPRDFALRWHRDDVSFSLSRAEEVEALGLVASPNSEVSGVSTLSYVKRDLKHTHTQYNIPLLRDSSFHIIPGSHLRPRTTEETRLMAQNPYTDALPGCLRVSLEPGDIVLYDNSLIHRGVYLASTERFTLHGSVGDTAGEAGRSRNVLQHGVSWISACDFSGLAEGGEGGGSAAARAEIMRRNLVRLGQSSGDVGYAHDD